MKKICPFLTTVFVLTALTSLPVHADTNTFPSSGNVGIGTVSPVGKLDIVGNSHAALGGRNIFGDDGNYNPVLRQYRWTGSAMDYYASATTTIGDPFGYPTLKFQVATVSANIGSETLTDVMTLKGYTGNVGIGTTNPGEKLSIDAGSVLVTNAGGQFIELRHTNNYGVRMALDAPTADLNFQTNNLSTYVNAMTIKRDSGNVGIGTMAPAAKLDVNGSIAYGNSGTRTESKDDAGAAGGRSGFYEASSPAPASNWYPGASFWQHLLDVRHSNTGNNYALQIAGSFFDQNLYFRKTNNDPSAGWSRFIAENSAGNVGIGTTTPGTYRLAVNGTIHAKEVIVDLSNWSDYVFAADYKLAPLSEVEAHIKAVGHLPDVPSAQEVAEKGISLGEMQSRLLSKIEELTLHIITQEKQIRALQHEIAQLKVKDAP